MKRAFPTTNRWSDLSLRMLVGILGTLVLALLLGFALSPSPTATAEGGGDQIGEQCDESLAIDESVAEDCQVDSADDEDVAGLDDEDAAGIAGGGTDGVDDETVMDDDVNATDDKDVAGEADGSTDGTDPATDDDADPTGDVSDENNEDSADIDDLNDEDSGDLDDEELDEDEDDESSIFVGADEDEDVDEIITSAEGDLDDDEDVEESMDESLTEAQGGGTTSVISPTNSAVASARTQGIEVSPPSVGDAGLAASDSAEGSLQSPIALAMGSSLMAVAYFYFARRVFKR